MEGVESRRALTGNERLLSVNARSKRVAYFSVDPLLLSVCFLQKNGDEIVW